MRRTTGAVAAVCAGLLAAPAVAQHEHHDEGVHSRFGTPIGSYPDLARASHHARAEARRLWKRSLRTAQRRFPTYRAARRLGYVRFRRKLERPVVFHLRDYRYDRDGRRLDARRPESLAYWWPRRRSPILFAYMYRMPSRHWPGYAKPLLGWHSHKPRSVLMTHVWMTDTLRSAIANCMPVPALEAANRDFRFAEPRQGYSRESHPCGEE
jgi:hypothetical protein